MVDSKPREDREAVDRAIALVEAALSACDEHGFTFAAIDLSAALDKLMALRDRPGDT